MLDIGTGWTVGGPIFFSRFHHLSIRPLMIMTVIYNELLPPLRPQPRAVKLGPPVRYPSWDGQEK